MAASFTSELLNKSKLQGKISSVFVQSIVSQFIQKYYYYFFVLDYLIDRPNLSWPKNLLIILDTTKTIIKVIF